MLCQIHTNEYHKINEFLHSLHSQDSQRGRTRDLLRYVYPKYFYTGSLNTPLPASTTIQKVSGTQANLLSKNKGTKYFSEYPKFIRNSLGDLVDLYDWQASRQDLLRSDAKRAH